MLQIKNLEIRTRENDILLKDISLSCDRGETIYLLGPNGSGKSTLAKALMGILNDLNIKGKILFDNKNILKMPISQRAKLGIFLGFQSPVEVPGVNFRMFLRLAFNNIHIKKEQLSVFDFKDLLKEKAKTFGIDEILLEKNLNEDLSGGEKKKMEILQMAVLQPKLVILDEIDSGLDIDSTKQVFQGLKKFRSENPQTILLIITHSMAPFSVLSPDKIFILKKGRIFRTGKQELVEEIKEFGFSQK